jgi:hypothetical protein
MAYEPGVLDDIDMFIIEVGCHPDRFREEDE